MHSEHVSSAQVERIVSAHRNDNWRVQTESFSLWDYDIITAVSRADIRSILWARSLSGVLAVIGLGLILLVTVALLIRHVVIKRLHGMNGLIEQITQGERDLTQKLNSDSSDELGVMACQFDTLLEQVRATIESVGVASAELSSESIRLKNIAETSGKLAGSQASEINKLLLRFMSYQ